MLNPYTIADPMVVTLFINPRLDILLSILSPFVQWRGKVRQGIIGRSARWSHAPASPLLCHHVVPG
jgi:hypothetical protein